MVGQDRSSARSCFPALPAAMAVLVAGMNAWGLVGGAPAADAVTATASASVSEYSAAATADGAQVSALDVAGLGSLAGLTLSRSAGTVASTATTATTATATNVLGSLTGLGISSGALGQTAPPDHPSATTGSLAALSIPTLLSAQPVAASAEARWATGTCLASGTPLSSTSTTLAGASLGSAAPGITSALLGLGAVTTTTRTMLASLSGAQDPRAVQTDATTSAVTTSILGGALSVGVAQPVAIRATASGDPATSGVSFQNAPVVSISGSGHDQTLSAGQVSTITGLHVGTLLTASVTVTAGSLATTADTGTSEAGSAFAYRVAVAVTTLGTLAGPGTPVESTSATVGPMSVAAGVAAGGLQCAPAGGGGAITEQPGNKTVALGSTATFSVGCPTGTSVQWQTAVSGGSAFADIPGANSDHYTTAAATAGDSGSEYRALCTDGGTTLTSTAATLTVTSGVASGPGPAITRGPVGATVFAGQQVSFTAAATGNPAPTVQWQSAPAGSSTFTDIAGATAPSYRTPPLPTAATGTRYRAVFRNSRGSAVTAAAAITVRALRVTAFRVPMGIRVGALHVAIPFTVVTNGPTGSVTVSIVRSSTGSVLASSTVNPSTTVNGSTTGNGGGSHSVVGAVRFGIASARSYGAYRWVVRIGNDQGSTLIRKVQVQANSLLVAHAHRSGPTVTISGRARRWNVARRTYQVWSAQRIRVQETTAHGWRTVATVTTSADGGLLLHLAAAPGTRFRLVVQADGTITGRVSNTVSG